MTRPCPARQPGTCQRNQSIKWPSRKNGGGYRTAGERYAVPLDWSKTLATDAFDDTIFRPALVTVGLPASAPTDGDTRPSRGPAPRPPPHVRHNADNGRDALHAGIKVVGIQYIHAEVRYIRRLDSGGGRRRRQQPARANSRPDGTQRPAAERRAAVRTPLRLKAARRRRLRVPASGGHFRCS